MEEQQNNLEPEEDPTPPPQDVTRRATRTAHDSISAMKSTAMEGEMWIPPGKGFVCSRGRKRYFKLTGSLLSNGKDKSSAGGPWGLDVTGMHVKKASIRAGPSGEYGVVISNDAAGEQVVFRMVASRADHQEQWAHALSMAAARQSLAEDTRRRASSVQSGTRT